MNPPPTISSPDLFSCTLSISAGAWSAVAATFSAVAAIVLLFVHLRNRADSVRPEVILEGFTLVEDPGGWAWININKITNEGKGPALHLRAQWKVERATELDTLPVEGLAYDPIAVLPAGKELTIAWRAIFYWKGGPASGFVQRSLPLRLTISMTDLHGRHYHTKYELVTWKSTKKDTSLVIAGATQIAPGLYQRRRHTAVTSRWWHRLSKGRVEGIEGH